MSRSVPLVLGVLAILCGPVLAQERVVLANPTWQVGIDPATLAIEAVPAGMPAVIASAGVAAHQVSGLESDAVRARWDWNGGAFTVELSLEGSDLVGTIASREPGEFVREPPAGLGDGLILPLAEGRYVPAGDPVWRDELTERLAEINTTEDLSLPLWGRDHGTFSLHWLLLNPFNNGLTFSGEGDAVAIAASHGFTRLDPDAPMRFILHLGSADPLAGARRYRQWLIDTGRFEPLAQKLEATPRAQKLIGASHVYLWGSGLLAPENIVDWPGFLVSLAGDDPLAQRVRAQFDAEGHDLLATAGERPQPYQQGAIVAVVNAALDNLARGDWQGDPTDASRLAAVYADLRQAVKATFRDALTPDPARWGSGEAIATIDALRSVGLSRLWIGFGEG